MTYTKESFTEKEIHTICKHYNIKNYTINSDMSIDVDGGVRLYSIGLTELPLKFNRVIGNFECSGNRLTTLKGCPNYVGGFLCESNKLTTLKYAPKEVDGDFHITSNILTSLKYLPEYIGGDLYCTDNKLTSLQHIRNTIIGKVDYKVNPLPKEILAFRNPKVLITNQNDYGIWYSDGSFNKGRWDIFFKDYKNGILK